MSESKLWEDLNRTMGPYWVADRIENNISKGVPDVFWSITRTHGMIELKHKKAWPKRENTIVRFRHFTTDQRNFLRRHRGRCFLLVQIDKDYLLFDWHTALGVGHMRKEGMFQQAALVFHNKIEGDALCKYLSTAYTPQHRNLCSGEN